MIRFCNVITTDLHEKSNQKKSLNDVISQGTPNYPPEAKRSSLKISE